jgi:cytochrome c biogenesis protein CcmG/thiol:disulfide interchange protein DsbE
MKMISFPRPLRSRRSILVAAAVASFLLLSCQESATAAGPKPGKKIDFQLKTVDGRALGPKDFPGQVVVVDFWATWCGPCMQEHEVLQRAARDHTPEVQFLGVVYDDEESRVREFLARYGTAYPTLLDDNGRTAIAYGVYGVPETYFIDAQGQIAFKYTLPLDEATIADGLNRIAPRAVSEAR